MNNLTQEQQKLILNRLAFKIISNEINSFEELNQTLNKFDFSELLENLELRKLELTQ